MDQDVGLKLKAVRLANQLSQRHLARKCGVANATISQIESGSLNPTVSMLKRILDGVPITLGEFFTTDTSASGQRIFFAASELTEIGEAGISYRQVGDSMKDKNIQLLHECYQPGTTTGKHPLSHDGEECGLVLSGCLEVRVGAELKTLVAGDAYYFNSQLPHSFRNAGKDECVLVSACTPPTF